MSLSGGEDEEDPLVAAKKAAETAAPAAALPQPLMQGGRRNPMRLVARPEDVQLSQPPKSLSAVKEKAASKLSAKRGSGKRKKEEEVLISSSEDEEPSRREKLRLSSRKKKKAKKSKKSKKSKRRRRDSSSSSDSEDDEDVITDEEEAVIETDYTIRDNGTTVLDLDLRMALRTPNLSPTSWWKAPWASRISKPIRSSSLYLGHVMGAARVHPDTIARVHDRCSPLKVIHLLTRNAEIDAGESKVMEHKGGKKWTVDKNWEKPSSVGEVIEAIMNLEALCLMIRNFSHEALAIHRVLHDLGFMMTVSATDGEQLSLVEESVNKILGVNSQRARSGQGPLAYTEAKDLVVKFLNSKGKAESSLFGCDPYSGKRRGNQDKEREEMKKELLSELKPLMKLGGGAGAHGGAKPQGGGKKTLSKEEKRAVCCEKFNTGSCSHPDVYPVAGCGKQHKCSRASETSDFVCMGKHAAKDCSRTIH